MYQKMTAYTVLAVALGYLLISAVPATLTPPEPEMLATGEEGEVFSAPSPDSSIRGPEPESLEEKATMNEVFQYSALIIDLLIALGVYIVARRRFG